MSLNDVMFHPGAHFGKVLTNLLKFGMWLLQMSASTAYTDLLIKWRKLVFINAWCVFELAVRSNREFEITSCEFRVVLQELTNHICWYFFLSQYIAVEAAKETFRTVFC